MFRNKSDVDKRVSALLYNAKNEHERNLRCYNIAMLYYKAHDFESAQRYATMYLSVRDDSAAAHKLLGQAFEKLGQKDKAVASYTKSLKLESDQSDLILKICELLCEKDVEFDPNLARYWSDRASLMFPHAPPVFMLKEKLIMSDSSLASKDLEELLHAELKSKPTDMNVRIKILKLYAESGRVELAVNHAFEVDARHSYNSLIWYQCINNICKIYNKDHSTKCNWEFYLQWISILNRICALCISESCGIRDTSEIAESIYNLDQSVYQANRNIKGPEIFREFLKYTSAQLAFYMGVLLLKKAKKENGIWKETKKLVSPLFFLASIPPPSPDASWSMTAKDSEKKLINLWIQHSHCRIVQAGYVLISLSKENHSEKMFVDKVSHFISSDWRLQIFEKTFQGLDHINGSTSHFMTGVEFNKVILKVPSNNSLKSSLYVSSFENVNFGSLHHLVWLGLQQLKKASISEIKLPSFRTTCFKSLQFTISNLNNIGVETINQLDIDTFLYATVFCAAAVLESQKSNGFVIEERLQVLPAVISPQLCTSEQSKWWTNVCSLVKGGLSSQMDSSESISDLRFNLQRGLEVARGEGLPPLLMVAIARTFASRALISDVIEESDGCHARALHLWKLVYPVLERFSSNKSLVTSSKLNILFDFPVDLNAQDAKSLLEEAKFFIGCHYMNTNQYEKAIEEFKSLKSPQAVYNLAMVYQKWAEDQAEGLRGEEITSEIRCRHVVLASKAREYLVKVKALIRNDPKHPLCSSIETKLFDIEDMLARVEPENGTSERDANGTIDGSVSGGSGGTPAFGDLHMVVSSSHRNRHHHTSTPRRIQEQKTNNFNMSELIDLLCVQHSTNQLKMQQVLEQVRLVVDKIEMLNCEQRNHIDGLTSRFNNFEAEMKTSISEIKKDIKRPDICNLFEEDDYTEEMLQYQNYTQYYPHTQRTVQNAAAAAAAAAGLPFGNQYYSPRLDPLYQGNLGFYNQGALPFSEGQQLPDFLRTIQPATQKPAVPQPFTMHPAHNIPAQLPLGRVANVPTTSKAGIPVNMIPSNIMLPTEPGPSTAAVPVAAPPLSVNIPPPNNKLPIVPAIPHNFQIPLPDYPKPVINLEERIEEETPPPAYDPLPDFKPLVPLPKEVEVTTGEEGEEILFEKKTKLFRFINSEWKERGIGILKILKNKDTGKFRIVMRREQVHKICANHFLTPDVSLEPKANADKAWVWVANDFADEEMRVEKFCAKFKTAEDSLEFKRVFDDVKKELHNQGDVSIGRINLNVTPVSSSSYALPASASPAADSSVFSSSIFKMPMTPLNLNTSTCKLTPFAGDNTSKQESPMQNKTSLGGFNFTLAKPKLKIPEEPKETKVEPTKENNPFSKLNFVSSPPSAKISSNFASIFGGATTITSVEKPQSITELKKTFDDANSGINKENKFVFTSDQTANTKDKSNEKINDMVQSKVTKNSGFSKNVPLSSIVKTVPGSWECKFCYIRNKQEHLTCEACQSKRPDSPAVSCLQSSATKSTSETPNLSSFVKHPPGSWECNICYILNKQEHLTCEACQSKRPDSSAVSCLQNSATKPTNETPNLSSFVKHPPGSWECKFCYVRNKSELVICEACGSKHPDVTTVSTEPTSPISSVKPASFTFGMPPQSVVDPPKFTFGSSNTTGILPPSDMDPPKFTFGSTSATIPKTFSFNATPVKPDIDSASVFSQKPSEFNFAPAQGKTAANFTFGTSTFQFIMPESKITSPTTMNKSLDESHDSEPEEEDADHLQFQPVIPLPDKIIVVTGEEDEKVLYCQRAKLFRYDTSSKEWKERGVGDIKILKHNVSGKIRFLMRRDQVMKICLNHIVTEDIVLRPKDEKSWLWYAVDYSEEVQAREQFAIRFKSAEIADEFKSAFDKLFENESDEPAEGTAIVQKQEEVSVNYNEKDPLSSPDCDLEIVYEQKAPPELVEKALALQFPANYYCYLDKPSCPGCCGCEPDEDEDEVKIHSSEQVVTPVHADVIEKPQVQDSPQPIQPTEHEPEKAKQSIFGFTPSLASSAGFSFASALQDTNFKTETVETKQNPGSGFYFFKDKASFTGTPSSPGSIFGVNSSPEAEKVSSEVSSGVTEKLNPKSGLETSMFAAAHEKPLFSAAPENPLFSVAPEKPMFSAGPEKPMFSAGPEKPMFSAGPEKPVFSAAPGKSLFSGGPEKPLFSTSDAVSFGSLAQTSTFNSFGGNQNFKWEGAGAQLFADIKVKNTTAGPAKAKDDAQDEDDGDDNDDEIKPEDDHDPQYDPVVPLPDKIEVKTGEEDEDIIFMERGQLYRYDNKTKEWKQRGTGDMKILKHKTNNAYRLIMRREQVHKLVCNHMINADFELKSKTEKAYCWHALNFCPENDGDPPVSEQLCIKFKHEETANRFRLRIEEATARLREE